ncbi:MAG TPA: AtpZ/AtpI family protein [Hyphomicrobiaceae bacterium]|nr:AtpZ/AtpI family protein [Hyphomicrobiaceae bacterium]
MPDDKNDRGPGAGSISREDREAFKARASEIARKLGKTNRNKAEPELNHGERGAAMGQAFKIAIELVVGVVFGGLIGWGLDRFFSTSGPWFLILFLVLGFAAGMMNVIRTAQRMQARAEHLQRSAPSIPDDGESDR